MAINPTVVPNPQAQTQPAPAAVHGFAQMVGLHPLPAVMTLAVNAMLFGGELATMGAIVPLGFAVAVVLAVITFVSQKRMYGDDDSEAMVKSLAVGLLTAIPVGLPAFLTVPSAIVGIVHTIRRKI